MFRIVRPTPAMIVAMLALVIAVSGSTFAIAQVQNGDDLIATRTLSGDRLRLNTVTGKEVMDLQWHPLTLLNGWVNYNGDLRPPAWALDVQGVVHFRGAIEGGTTTRFARLPLSIRPAVFIYLVTNLNLSALGRIYIAPDGYVYAEAYNSFTDAQAFTSLDGITYAVN